MTPARLEEAREQLEDRRRFYAGVAPHMHAIASELLAEVDRLRKALESIWGKGCDGWTACDENTPGLCERCLAEDALYPEEPEP